MKTPTNISGCAALALVIRAQKLYGKTQEVEEGFRVLTHALMDLAAQDFQKEPAPGSEEAKLWEKFDRQQPKPHEFS